MNDYEGPTCVECKGREFETYDNGELVCPRCLIAVADHVETVLEFGSSSYRVKPKSHPQQRKGKVSDKIPEWNLYQGFNIILVKMTNALLKCGQFKDPKKIKDCVHQLWAAYLFKIEVVKLKDRDAAVGHNLVHGEPSIIPAWFSQPLTQEEDDTSASEAKQDLLFAPAKVPLKKRKQNKNRKGDLTDIPDDDLSSRDLRKKKKQLKNSFMKLAIRDAGTDKEKAEQILASEKEEDEEEDVQLARILTMKDAVPDAFPDNVSVDSILRSTKTKDFAGPKSTLDDPEYLTLHKLLSFLHAACLMKGELISHADLVRWVREGFIPLYGAHQLLPPSMPLSRHDSKILGGVSTGKSKGFPESKKFRQNTASLLNLLNITLLPKPPTILVASKILCDLQLPDDLQFLISALDKLVSEKNTDEWKLNKFGSTVNSEVAYAGAMVVIALKMTLGLDGITENKISKFAEQVNSILNVKPSSGFSRQKQTRHRPSSEMKTLFVWEDWVRFIEFQRLALERNHVPTAIRKRVVGKMDTESVQRFAKNEGYLHCHRPSNPIATAKNQNGKKEEVVKILGKPAEHVQSSDQPPKRIPVFRPCILGINGLAEQLVEFDESQFGLLKQEFPTSCLDFTIDYKPLATELKKENYKLTVCMGPAYEEATMSMPFIASHRNMSKLLECIDRHGWRPIKLNPTLIDASTSSDTEDEEDDENEDVPKLVLYHPCSMYWSKAGYFKNMSNSDWSVFSAELPAMFLWVLDLVSEVVGEAPKDLYIKLFYLETIICLRHQKLTHTITSPKILKHRLVSALRKEL